MLTMHPFVLAITLETIEKDRHRDNIEVIMELEVKVLVKEKKSTIGITKVSD